jgi:hypothetical protein
MAGLVPAIHVFVASGMKDVDARVKRGHDGENVYKSTTSRAGSSSTSFARTRKVTASRPSTMR